MCKSRKSWDFVAGVQKRIKFTVQYPQWHWHRCVPASAEAMLPFIPRQNSERILLFVQGGSTAYKSDVSVGDRNQYLLYKGLSQS